MDFQYRVISCKPLSNVHWKILAEPIGTPITYLAGQYVEIFNADKTSSCPYSIATAPQQNHRLEFHLKIIPNTPLCQDILKQCQEQNVLKFRGPFGHCTYQKLINRPVIFLAGGTGFAPIKAMIEKSIEEHDGRSMHLFWGAKTKNELYMPELPTQWARNKLNFAFIPVLETAPADWSGAVGLPHETIQIRMPNLEHYQIYAAGPFEMIQKAKQNFVKLGLEPQYFYSDLDNG